MPKNTPERHALILAAIDRLAQRGSASGDQAAGPALARILRAALDEDVLHAGLTNGKATDPRSVVLGVFKNVRSAMKSLRDELDSIDSIGY